MGITVNPFRTVDQKYWITHYQGKIPQNPSGYYNLFADFIEPAIAEIMLRERLGSATTNTDQSLDTHVIMATVSLNKDAGHFRTLFQIYFNLSKIAKIYHPIIIHEITRGLKREILRCRSLGYLVRCRNQAEFPFCIDNDNIDDFWFGYASAYYRWVCKQLDIDLN